MASIPVAVTLINLYINQEEFALVNNVLKKYTDMEEEIKKIWRRQQLIKYFNLFVKQCYHIVWSVTEKADSKNTKVPKVNEGKLMILSVSGELPHGKFPLGKSPPPSNSPAENPSSSNSPTVKFAEENSPEENLRSGIFGGGVLLVPTLSKCWVCGSKKIKIY